MIQKILIANRGEIAVRVIRTAGKMGIRTVAVYSRIDGDSLHVSLADESYCIGEAELSETYLNIPVIIGVAKRAGCDAIHPGYGFLAENPAFVKACDEAGILFIGPSSRSMQSMGNKIEARAFAKKINVPITEGMTGDPAALLKARKTLPYPVLLKAAAGGGGKGMVIVNNESELKDALESSARQAKAYFGDETVYIEKYLDEPRHIEFQILADHHGNVIHLFERECSIQRRYQKIIEESPSPTLTPEVRKKMGEAAVRIGKEIGYTNAGTIEFLVDRDLNYYFLEMNTRIQVEHPVTELVTGIDIVEEQIHIASGEKLRLRQEDIVQKGHAIECRIYAEDPENNFLPSPGTMSLYREPVMQNIRIDTGITPATVIKPNFDPMICKLIAWGKEREEARMRVVSALGEYIIHGIRTNINYLVYLLKSDAFIQNRISTKFCDLHTGDITQEIRKEHREYPASVPVAGYLLSAFHNAGPSSPADRDINLWERIGYWRIQMMLRLLLGETEYWIEVSRMTGNGMDFMMNGEAVSTVKKSLNDHRLEFMIGDRVYHAWVSTDRNNTTSLTLKGMTFRLKRQDLLTESDTAYGSDLLGSDSNHISAPMPGKVIKIHIREGDTVKKGDVLMIIEAMKMENLICSSKDAVVKQLNVSLNDRVETSTHLVVLEPAEN